MHTTEGHLASTRPWAPSLMVGVGGSTRISGLGMVVHVEPGGSGVQGQPQHVESQASLDLRDLSSAPGTLSFLFPLSQSSLSCQTVV